MMRAADMTPDNYGCKDTACSLVEFIDVKLVTGLPVWQCFRSFQMKRSLSHRHQQAVFHNRPPSGERGREREERWVAG